MSAVRIRASAWAARVPRADLIAVLIPTLVGVLLCAIELNTRSFWLDEGATFSITSQHGAALWHGIAHDGGNMLLYYLLIHVVISLFGSAAWVIRLPSVLALGVTGGLTTSLGLRLLGDRRHAVAAGLLTVVSLPLIFWGQDARGYALMVTLATASMLAFVHLLDPSQPFSGRFLGERARNLPNNVAPGRAALAAYVLTTTAALYVGYDAGLLILAQLALLPLFKDRAKLVIAALVAVAMLSIPLLVLALERGSSQLFWVPPLTGSVLGQSVQTLLSAAMPAKFHSTGTTVLAEVVFGLLLLAALTLAVREASSATDTSTTRRLWLLLAWLLVPTVIALLVSVAGKPIELDRCTILLMPALSLLMVWALFKAQLPSWLPPLLLAAVLALRLVQIVPAYSASPEDWKAATAYVLKADARQPACVAFYPEDGRQVFDYYLRGDGSKLTPVLPTLPWSQIKPYVEQYDAPTAAQLTQIAAHCPRLFLLASHIGQTSGPALSRAHAKHYAQLKQQLKSRYATQQARTFGWSGPVYVIAYSKWGRYP